MIYEFFAAAAPWVGLGLFAAFCCAFGAPGPNGPNGTNPGGPGKTGNP